MCDNFTFIGDGVVVGDARFRRAYDRIVGYCRQLGTDLGAEPLHPAALLPLSAIRDAGYLTNFPHHVLTARPYLREIGQPGEEYVLSPAACLCVFAMLRGTRLTTPCTHAFTVTCGRYEEGHTAEPLRLASYNIHETVCIGDRARVTAFFERARGTLDALAAVLPGTEVVVACDAFFGPDARAKRFYQERVRVKFELQAPVGADRVAIASINAHGQVFGTGFGIEFVDSPAFSACFGVGLERATSYALQALGPDAADWPALEPIGSPS